MMKLEDIDTLLFDYNHNLLAIISDDWKFVDVSLAWQRVLGYSLEELKKINIPDLIHPDDLSETKSYDKSDSRIVNIINRYKHKDGHYIWLKWRSSPLADKPNFWLTAAEDISETKQYQLKLRESNQRFEDAAEVTGSVIFEFDTDFNIIYVSSRVQSSSGFTASKLSQMSIFDLIHPDDRDNFKNYLVESVKNKKIFQNKEIRLRDASGNFVYRRIYGKPFYDDQENLLGYRGASIDITETKNVMSQLEFERSKGVHAAKLSALGEMAGGIAHEINNPLNIINGFASMIELEMEKPATEIRSEFIQTQLDKIFSTVDRISKIVKGMKKFSRSGSSDELEGVVLKDIFDNTFMMCTEKFRNAGIKFITPGIVSSGVFVYCREIEISQVLLNLLNNAFDAVKDLKENRLIEVTLEVLEGTVVIKVKDSAPKIPELVVQKMFEPFFSTKEVGKGTGLGLSISKSIITNNKGTLEYTDNDEKAFTIKLEQFSPDLEDID
jgi:PAS domain S-box-containing protein